MIDKHGRIINYLRVSLTDKCNLRCIYCMPEICLKSNKENPPQLKINNVIKMINAVSKLGIEKIRYTGGEPLVVKNIDKLIYETHKINAIKDIALTTNGIFLEEMIYDLKVAGLNQINISLDTLRSDRYKKITRGGELNKVFKALEKSLGLGFKAVKINTVLLKGINDDEIRDFINLTKEYPIHVRFIELMPLGEGIKYYDKFSMTSREVLQRFPELIQEKRNEVSTAEIYTLKNAIGKVGFISPLSCKFCDSCNKIRLTSEGKIKPCLHSDEEIDIMPYLDNEKELLSRIGYSIMEKPKEHHIEEVHKTNTHRMMFQIGG
ncbi:GTP 3',8-cyclase MoaA [Clostridium sp. BSD9I1]|uniref:GTP 3',8-cyclase MoaA n=1 Tax=Clostridium sp. BSD9I1 TaxID=2003589 RepID=UPI001646F729|nr:GTP 3',8-cyclase MoaA [Clostridium sp. BSD9I1]